MAALRIRGAGGALLLLPLGAGSGSARLGPPGAGCRGRRCRRRRAPPALAELLCGSGAHAGPLASGGAIGCGPSCASLDTPAAPRRAARCANSGSAGRALKGTRAPFLPTPPLQPPPSPLRNAAARSLLLAASSPRSPGPGTEWDLGGGGVRGGWKGKVGQGGAPAAKGLTPLLLTPPPPLPPEPRRRATPPRCSDSSAVAKVQARSAPIGQTPRDARLRRFPLAIPPRRLRPPRAPRRGRE